jgi:biopolymer transport protein ExbB
VNAESFLVVYPDYWVYDLEAQQPTKNKTRKGRNKSMNILRICLVSVLLLSIFGVVREVLAERPVPPPAASVVQSAKVEEEALPLREVIKSGGSLMYVLGLLSLIGVALVIYFFIVLKPSEMVPLLLMRDVVDHLKAGRLEEAQDLCTAHPCLFSYVAMAGILYARKANKIDNATLKDIIEGEGARRAEAMLGQVQYLLDIAVISPMVGLLGTVVGMLKAFGAVATDIARARPVSLAAGVSQALITTIFGLIIAIPAMCFYAYFRRKASSIISQAESAAVEVLTAIQSRSTSTSESDRERRKEE